MTNSFPIIVIQDRYGRGWVAIAQADRPEVAAMLQLGVTGPWGGDTEAYEFFEDPGPLAAYGEAPDIAIMHLEEKLD